MSQWSTTRVAGVIRFVVLPLLGALGVVHETLIWSGDTREPLLLLFGAMMGIPLPSLADWFKSKGEGKGKDQEEEEAAK